MDVLLPALAARKQIRDAAMVLKLCRELTPLADNQAYVRAEELALRLSSLLVSLEFPPYDLGCGSDGYSSTRGAAAAMPEVQVRCLAKQPVNRDGCKA